MKFSLMSLISFYEITSLIHKLCHTNEKRRFTLFFKISREIIPSLDKSSLKFVKMSHCGIGGRVRKNCKKSAVRMQSDCTASTRMIQASFEKTAVEHVL